MPRCCGSPAPRRSQTVIARQHAPRERGEDAGHRRCVLRIHRRRQPDSRRPGPERLAAASDAGYAPETMEFRSTTRSRTTTAVSAAGNGDGPARTATGPAGGGGIRLRPCRHRTARICRYRTLTCGSMIPTRTGRALTDRSPTVRRRCGEATAMLPRSRWRTSRRGRTSWR